jgi:hypothetical protein
MARFPGKHAPPQGGRAQQFEMVRNGEPHEKEAALASASAACEQGKAGRSRWYHYNE